MRSFCSPVSYGIGLAAVFGLFALILMVTPDATAGGLQGTDRGGSPACDCPQTGKRPARPKYADYKSTLDQSDEIATLDAVSHALSEVGDGATYVWHRSHGRLSALIRPVSSFKNDGGLVCRHVIIMLSAGTYTSKREGVACRGLDGVWALEG